MFLPEATPIDASRFFRPMIEIEIALVMKHALKGPGVGRLRATDFVVPRDCRFPRNAGAVSA